MKKDSKAIKESKPIKKSKPVITKNIKIKALRSVDFDWVVYTDNVWNDFDYDVSELNKDIKNEILNRVGYLKARKKIESPLGITILGQGGAGKTHLLGILRKEAAKRGIGFIMVDMSGVNNFWDTVLLKYLDSLEKPYFNKTPQYQALIEYLIDKVISKDSDANKIVKKLSKKGLQDTIKYTNAIIQNLGKKYKKEILDYQDIIRALIYFNSEDIEISNIGYSWLQGIGVEDDEKKTFKFKTAQQNSQQLVKALSWLMSLKGPVILALDQIDAIVAEHAIACSGVGNSEKLSDEQKEELSDKQKASLSIIEGIAGGMRSLVDSVTKRTQVVATCLEATWNQLCNTSVSTNKARFEEPPLTLKNINNSKLAEKIIVSRLSAAYKKNKFKPKYKSWPFKKQAFKKVERYYPRELLQACDKLIKKCIKKNEIPDIITIVDPTPPPPNSECEEFTQLNKKFNQLRQKAQPAELLDEKNEDKLTDNMLETAFICIVKENPPPDNVDPVVDLDFSGEKKIKFLHVRIKLLYRDENDREEHFCLRAILKSNATAYQNRLKAAMTTSGIDRNLKFRRLVIVRNGDIPGGPKTKKLTDNFIKDGGLFTQITEDELRTLWALYEMMKKKPTDFDDWLKSCKPVSKLPFILNTMPELCPPSIIDPPPPKSFKIGKRIVGSQLKNDVNLKLTNLLNHSIILAGSGSGKTVLVRRIVEEAAIRGIPSIVVDCANDLARLGDAWPTRPKAFQKNDVQQAAQYHKKSDTVIWTPGLEKGNPLQLQTLPDITALVDDKDELNQAISMVRESLRSIVAPGKSLKSKNKIGILSSALKYFAKNNGGDLTDFIEVLSDLQPEASGGIHTADKLALEMSDSLKAEMQINPLLKKSGTCMDPAMLFGVNEKSDKTRISVINYVGLMGLETQQQFLNQLAMTLFTWIKKNPAENNSIRGLFVIDEAKDYVPSAKDTPCKESLLRLAAQARKYGLGLIFATQAPKSIDHNIIANCSTQFYGKANSPAAINTIQEQLKLKGGSGKDIAKLSTGQFYFHSKNMDAPFKIATPLCLSYHPNSPLNEIEVVNRAKKSRVSLGSKY
ncbi:ATPase AAA [Candidatus Magnetomoraceae bacterium gMMP-15]